MPANRYHKTVSLSATLLSVLLAGCFSFENYQGPRMDPLLNTGLESTPAFPNLKLAVMLSENAKKTLQITYQGSLYGGYSAREYIDKMYAVYRRNFQTVIQVERAEDARQAKVDLIAVIDDYAPKMGFINRQETTVIFLTPDNRKIDEIKAAFEKRMGWNTKKDVEAFSVAINGQLEEGMRKSRPLADFAKERPQGPSPAAAPVAADKEYRSDVDRPGYSAPGRPDAYALVIGIEKYSSLPDADFAERDAASMRGHLLALGYPERNVVFLKDSQAGKASIEKYVESWLPRNVKEGSQVMVYFSGHGAPDPATHQAYIVPWDGDTRFLENTGYPVRRLYEKLNALKARDILVAMDACFSGAGGRSVLTKGTRPLVTKIDAGEAALGRVVALAATGPDEVTGSEASQGHGVFTYYLLKGLQEKSGKADVRGLFDYLRPRVQDAARRENRDQTPQLLPASDVSRAAMRF